MEALGTPKQYRLFKRQEQPLEKIAEKKGVKTATVMRWAMDYYLAREGAAIVFEEPPEYAEQKKSSPGHKDKKNKAGH